jgi:hypothetical protein
MRKGAGSNWKFDKIAVENKRSAVRNVAIWKGTHERSEVGIYNLVTRCRFLPKRQQGLKIEHTMIEVYEIFLIFIIICRGKSHPPHKIKKTPSFLAVFLI